MVVWLVAVFVIQRILNKEMAGLKTVQLEINGSKIEAEVADTFFSRMRGLSGRENLGENKGMLFVFDSPAVQSFWMKGMKFPIDIIWINNDEVVGFAENAPTPDGLNIPSFSPPSAVDKVLELNAGSVQRIGIKKGDEIK